MERVPDWYVKYNEFVNDMRHTPFEWGKNDCGPSWAGRLVATLRGCENPAAEFSGRYKTPIGAVRVMRESGFQDLKEAVTHYLGEPQHPSRGYIGDIALIRDDSSFRYSLGIVNGERVFFRREDGIGTVDLLECDCIFKV